MPLAWGHTRLLETDWRLITQESHCFSCGSVNSEAIKFSEKMMGIIESIWENASEAEIVTKD